jgi:hypothetical protein
MGLKRTFNLLSGVSSPITASGSTGRLTEAEYADALVVVVDCQSAPGGTSPSLTFSVNYIDPNTGNAYPLTPSSGAFAAITAVLSTPQRVVFDPLYDSDVELVWTVSGTSPSFGGVSVSACIVDRSDNAVG